MLTPQEVSERVFAKASFGGYNMSMVDEFLDQLTVDYTALYKENASLKAKMKVLADSLEEYRATEKGMRRALLAAQQAADEMVKEAETRKSSLIRDAESVAQARIDELKALIADEEARLAAAQAATAAFVEQAREACNQQLAMLDSLPAVSAAPSTPVEQAVFDIEQSVQKLLEEEDAETEEAEEAEEEEGEELINLFEAPRSRRDMEREKSFDNDFAAENEAESSPTRRIDFDNLQFGSNYNLK